MKEKALQFLGAHWGKIVIGLVVVFGIYFFITKFSGLFSDIEKKSEATVDQSDKIDFERGADAIDYADKWLKLHAPYVMKDCFAKRVQPKDCVAPKLTKGK